MRLTPQTTKSAIPEFNTNDGPKEVLDSDNVIEFSDEYTSFCVGIVDVINSTGLSSLLSYRKMINFYGLFLNTMGSVVRKFGGNVVKNVGDSLLFYFPDTCDTNDNDAIKKCVECGMSMIESRDILNERLSFYQIPPIGYRISMDYGKVVLAGSSGSSSVDIFGPTVNLCAKINGAALPNTVVVGGDMYEIVKWSTYDFKALSGYFTGLKFGYPVYTVTCKNGHKQ